MSQQNSPQSKNDRISQVLKMLQAGQPRDKIADQFGYSTWKSLDIYMRRHGFSWDGQKQLYTISIPAVPPEEESNLPSADINPAEVVRLFSMGILDSREIAKRTGFSGHKEMALYMLQHGYIWSATSLNYINPNSAPPQVDLAGNHAEDLQKTSELKIDHLEIGNGNICLEKYKTLLEFLWQSRDQLIKIIETTNTENQIQIYTIPVSYTHL